MNLESLKRFDGVDGRYRLQKIGSKRDNSRVGVGQYETGDFYIYVYPATANKPEQIAAEIVGNGFNYLRTSPIVKIVDFDENSTTFETEGGIYRLEKTA